MSTQATTTTATAKATPETKEPKTRAPRRTFSINFDGAGDDRFRLAMRLGKDGKFSTLAIHTTKDAKGKKVHTRGASAVHATQEAAEAAVEAMAKDAAKLGWVRRTRSAGFKARPDAFDAAHLPAPKPAAKPTAKK